jgi:tricorn protease
MAAVTGTSRRIVSALVNVFALALFLALPLALSSAEKHELFLFRDPSLSRTQIAFSYAGNIWVVSRDGGEAQRITTGGHEFVPRFSPDGTQIAFTGQYDGNTDVFVVPTSGGVPKRLTWHPGADVVIGWTPDGQNILFTSTRDSGTDPAKFFTVPVGGGFPTELPLPAADHGVFSPDGTKLAYAPDFQWEHHWKHYRGGQTQRIWIVNLADSSIEQRIPQENNSNDFNPMWIGSKIYFLSDRNGLFGLFEYDLGTHNVTEVLKNTGLEFESASAGPDGIVIEQFGQTLLYDLSSGKSREVKIHAAGDFPEVRPHFEKLDSKKILNAGISPSGARAVFETHGEIITVPAEKGDIRNLTNSPAVADRDPAWSPDGKSIAYFSDETGEYALHIAPQNGLGPVKKISLGNKPGYYYTPTWSPDSKKIAYEDLSLSLWYVDVENGTPVRVDTDRLDQGPSFSQTWSPDSRWIAYIKPLKNNLHGVFIYSIETAKSEQISDGMSDTSSPAFDKNGKYLYFTASTDVALAGEAGMTSIGRPVTRSIYTAVLKKDVASPVAPESDEEKSKEEKAKEDKEKGKDPASADADKDKSKDKAKDSDKDKDKSKEAAKEPPKVDIDFERIGQRIVAMPTPARNYLGLAEGKEGELYIAEASPTPNFNGPPSFTLQKFTLKTRKTEKFLDGIASFSISADGEKILYKTGDQWFIAAAASAPKSGDGVLRLGDMEVYVDPRAEWRQVYHEIWRIERDFLYDPHAHGFDLAAGEKFFAPYLENIACRSDLNYLFREMLSNISIGHMFVGGGDAPEARHVRTGLLGADYKIENGRYRFARIFDGENWNPDLTAPLTQPGVNVSAGDYLLAVNGRELHGSDNVYSYFEETAGKQVVLKVAPNADGSGSRDVTVVPVDDEFPLRHLKWVEDNRRKVDQMTGGRVAYVHVPDTAYDGYTSFNRYYFSQIDKQAAIIDERFNHGGFLADYIVDYLRRPILNRVMTRLGDDISVPTEAIYGPKVMLVNRYAGSGGDALPWYFRKLEIGPLVGTRTWGGLVGIGGYPQLIDGGFITAPRWAIYGLNGEWEVENHGIAPDYEVELDPKAAREGRDPQLEKAVEVVLEEMKKNPPPAYKRPAYPDYHPQLPATQ